MSFEDKFNEYKERREAKAYFNRNNDAIIDTKGYAIAILAGLLTAIIGGYLSEVIAVAIGYYFSYLFVGVGFVIGFVMKKVTNVGTLPLGVLAVVIYVVGVVLGIGLNMAFTNNISMATSVSVIIRMLSGDILSVVIILFGAYTAFNTAGK